MSTPPCYFPPKDHKPIPNGKKLPKTRMVCGATNGPNSRISNLISTPINLVATDLDEDTESLSTEDMKAEIMKANKELEEKEYKHEVTLMSMDVLSMHSIPHY